MSEEPLLSQRVAALTQYFVGDAAMGETLERVSELTTIGVGRGSTASVDSSPSASLAEA